jgi:hypothetical protein
VIYNLRKSVTGQGRLTTGINGKASLSRLKLTRNCSTEEEEKKEVM